MKRYIKITVLVMACLLTLGTLTSCGKSIDGLEKKALDAGFECERFDSSALLSRNAALDVMKIEGDIVSGMTVKSGNYDAEIYEFNSTQSAKDYFEYIKTSSDRSFLDPYKGEGIVEAKKRSGKIVITGDKAIIDEIW